MVCQGKSSKCYQAVLTTTGVTDIQPLKYTLMEKSLPKKKKITTAALHKGDCALNNETAKVQ